MSEQGLDWNDLELPSDRLTLGSIRRAHADLFAGSDRGISQPLIILLAFDILSNEMDLAALAFAEAAGQNKPDLMVSRQDIINALMRDYAVAGIGAGDASRQALIKKIESDAVSQVQSGLNR